MTVIFFMGVGQGGQEGRRPPHFYDAGVGGPCHFEKGAPLYLHEKGYTVIRSKLY